MKNLKLSILAALLLSVFTGLSQAQPPTTAKTFRMYNSATSSVSITADPAATGTGTFTWPQPSAGLFKSTSLGVMSIGAVNINTGSTDITGILSVTNGGTGASSFGAAGTIAYSTGTTGPLGFSAAGTTGQILVSGGSGTPTWTSTLPAGTGVPFNLITTGTNTAATMTVGAGSSLTYSGGVATSGVINSNQLLGGTWAIPGQIGLTTPNTGAFTTLSSSGTTSINTGTSSATTSIGNNTNGSDITLQTKSGANIFINNGTNAGGVNIGNGLTSGYIDIESGSATQATINNGDGSGATFIGRPFAGGVTTGSGSVFIEAGTGKTVSINTTSTGNAPTNIGHAGSSTNVTSTLQLTGTASPLSLNGSAGTAGQVLQSAGAGATPVWSSLPSQALAKGRVAGDGTNFSYIITPGVAIPATSTIVATLESATNAAVTVTTRTATTFTVQAPVVLSASDFINYLIF